jgi:hypothetical protein
MTLVRGFQIADGVEHRIRHVGQVRFQRLGRAELTASGACRQPGLGRRGADIGVQFLQQYAKAVAVPGDGALDVGAVAIVLFKGGGQRLAGDRAARCG